MSLYLEKTNRGTQTGWKFTLWNNFLFYPMYSLEFVEIIQISLQWNHILRVSSDSMYNVKILHGHNNTWRFLEHALDQQKQQWHI